MIATSYPHVTVIFRQCQSGINGRLTGSYRHVRRIGDQRRSVHQWIARFRIDQLRKLFQNLCHLISTLAASDIYDNIRIRPFCRSDAGSSSYPFRILPGSQPFHLLQSGTSYPEFAVLLPAAHLPGISGSPVSVHGSASAVSSKFSFFSIEQFNRNQRLINCIFTIRNHRYNSPFYSPAEPCICAR